jgi:hypothetical protein
MQTQSIILNRKLLKTSLPSKLLPLPNLIPKVMTTWHSNWCLAVVTTSRWTANAVIIEMETATTSVQLETTSKSAVVPTRSARTTLTRVPFNKSFAICVHLTYRVPETTLRDVLTCASITITTIVRDPRNSSIKRALSGRRKARPLSSVRMPKRYSRWT